MIVMFSARRLKPGAWEQFRRAWDPGESKPPGFQRAYHARNIRDEDEVISFGLFDMSEDDYRRWRAEADAEEMQRVDHLSAFVESQPVEGVYEVVETVDESALRRQRAIGCRRARFEYFDSWALTRRSSLAPAASLRGSMRAGPTPEVMLWSSRPARSRLRSLLPTPSAARPVRSGAGIAPDLTIPRKVVT